MEKEKQLEPKLLRRELFRVKCPRRIVAGDPYYFETEPPERLKKLVVDYIPPRSYEARLVLSQYEMHDFGVYQTNAVQIYLAPGKDVDVYAAEKMYADQRIEQKEIGVILQDISWKLMIDGKNSIREQMVVGEIPLPTFIQEMGENKWMER